MLSCTHLYTNIENVPSMYISFTLELQPKCLKNKKPLFGRAAIT